MTLPALSSQSLADQAYQALRAAIVRGDLPWGEKITERGLAARLGVSATPVREALRRLEQEQLVEHTGPRSLRVVTVSPEERSESGAIEAALEGVAARLAAHKATEAQLKRMGTLLDEADAAADALRGDRDAGRELSPDQIERIFDAVRAFHREVEQAAANTQLTRTLDQVRAFSRSERLKLASAQLTAGSEGQIRRYAQHREILEALRERDAERAEQLARTHASSAASDLAGWDAS
ncbi:MAG TPA: GntR family transcriptional regulator [Actinocrinis sp.]|jgi:DNA-binding GntR family transcriptional regulator|uniref:GntR family transcriptional regulator n=1 Tax=Actinocrinis sp. TaxID=1920516 RepID=UPI002DDCF62D|nr:GntR family transcriptional regulator [Actinocrinis sp.]HEV3173790.1 GntR family transcriptional regulator [Actinocrinis sp.]